MGPSPSETTLAAASPGAQVHRGGVTYVVWAPAHGTVSVEVRRDGGTASLPMEPMGGGYFRAADVAGRAGDRYRFHLPGGARLPDPVSRFQPDGVHGASECIDPAAFRWRCADWRRPGWRGQSIYELHVGTFTPEGTFRAATARLDHLRELGVGAIELMPVADFAGTRNWGYDGVALYAPAHGYGRPDDLRAFVDAAHLRGLAVLLDVVYNHPGPAGNYLPRYAAAYFHSSRETPWGKSFNLSDADSRPVRDFLVGNAAYWLDEFRFDGLRLDATHAIVDDSPRHLLDELAETAHQRGAFVIAEDERNSAALVRRRDGGGHHLDAVWADDFHHQVRVALTGARESYFASYTGTPAAVARTMDEGWYYTGQSFPSHHRQPRGEPCRHLPPSAFVYCIENHDQVGNRARGERLEHLVAADAFRAASALLCLSPYPPLLFMGQEWAASTPFLYFTDHEGELGRQVTEGRRREFAGLHGDAAQAVPDPQDPATYRASQLKWDETHRPPHAGILALYRDALRQRREWLNAASTARARWDVAAVADVVVLRYRPRESPDRLLVCRLGGAGPLALAGDPLLQPPEGRRWRVALDSEASCYGGAAPPARLGPGDALRLPGPATVLLIAEDR